MPITWGKEVTRAWVGFEVRGWEELAAATRKAIEEFAPGLYDTMDKATIVVEEEAKVKSSGRPGPNVVTGAHRASMSHDVRLIGGQDVQGAAGAGKVYSPYLEFGTRWMPPYPYLLPAYEEKEEEVLNLLDKFVDGVATTIETY